MIRETKINHFDGGITNDSRDLAGNVARIVSNFDILSKPHKMIPYRSSESGDSSASTSQKQNFCIALRSGTTYNLFALGRQSALNRPEVLMKTLTTGLSNDLGDAGWASPANNQSSLATPAFSLFVYYAKVGRIFGAVNGTRIWVFDPASSAVWLEDGTGNSRSLTYTNIAQGLVHSKDDILYIPYDNKIAKNDNGTWTDAALTLPTHYYIRSICEVGNFLAIAVAPLSGVGNSRVYLWDRDTTLATLSETINWGEGDLRILEEVDGVLLGISLKTGSYFTTDKVTFRYLSGNVAVKFKEITWEATGTPSTLLPIAKQQANNRLFFMMRISFNGAIREGVWSIGRSSPSSSFSLIHERTPNNNSALASSQNLLGFFMVGDFMFISYTDGGTIALSKTDDIANYSHNSVYESKRFDGSIHGFDSSYYKDLQEVIVNTEYMPAAGQITLAYRTDANTAWTTIFTNSTANSISHTATNIESSGAILPRDYKEIEFRILATGGAEITGLQFKEDIKERKYIVD